ncbi:MAG: hypothetical protein AAFY71_18060 [Bacteroidota bacterium]
MINKEEIDRIYLQWLIEEENLITMMFSRSGSINRRGDGENLGGRPAMGRVEEPLFQQLLEALPLDWFQNTGRYTLPDPKGKMAKLTLAFEGEKLDTGFEFMYGTQSDGPPEDMVEYIEFAMELSEEWYQSQGKKKKR